MTMICLPAFTVIPFPDTSILPQNLLSCTLLVNELMIFFLKKTYMYSALYGSGLAWSGLIYKSTNYKQKFTTRLRDIVDEACES